MRSTFSAMSLLATLCSFSACEISLTTCTTRTSAVADAGDGFAALLGQRQAMVHPAHRLVHGFLRLARAFLMSAIMRAISSVADEVRSASLRTLIGHHGKATALLAGAGGLNRRVQRQQIGLVGHF